MERTTSDLKRELALVIPGAGAADVRITYRGNFNLGHIQAAPSKTVVFVGHHLTTEQNVDGNVNRKAGETHKFWLDLPDGTTERMTASQLAQYLPAGVQTVYFAGCNSMSFAEDLKRLRPKLTVYGIPVTKDAFEVPRVRGRSQEYQLRLRDKATGQIEPLHFDKADPQPEQPVPVSRDLL